MHKLERVKGNRKFFGRYHNVAFCSTKGQRCLPPSCSLSALYKRYYPPTTGPPLTGFSGDVPLRHVSPHVPQLFQGISGWQQLQNLGAPVGLRGGARCCLPGRSLLCHTFGFHFTTSTLAADDQPRCARDRWFVLRACVFFRNGFDGAKERLFLICKLFERREGEEPTAKSSSMIGR